MKSFAMVFPGQGSQSVGMLAEMAAEYPLVLETFAIAHDALGQDLWSMVVNGPEEALNQTVNTQPALLTAGVAIWRVWQSLGGANPHMMAGHSLGEYTALVCSGAIALGDAVRCVAQRGKLMQTAVPKGEGAMAAILGLDVAAITEICYQAAEGQVVAPANFNAQGQTVIAGEQAAVARALALATEQGAKRVVPLPVSVPSHCLLMKPASEQFAQTLADLTIAMPTIPVVHNVDVSISQDPEALRARLLQQLYSPVRWYQTIEFMVEHGIEQVVESGPGKVLTGLNKRIDKRIDAVSIETPALLQKILNPRLVEEGV